MQETISPRGADASPSRVYFEPAHPPLRLEEFPTALQPLAQRKCLAGVGSAEAPFVMGWCVSAGANAGGLDAEAERWLKEQGFERVGSQWSLSDRCAK